MEIRRFSCDEVLFVIVIAIVSLAAVSVQESQTTYSSLTLDEYEDFSDEYEEKSSVRQVYFGCSNWQLNTKCSTYISSSILNLFQRSPTSNFLPNVASTSLSFLRIYNFHNVRLRIIAIEGDRERAVLFDTTYKCGRLSQPECNASRALINDEHQSCSPCLVNLKRKRQPFLKTLDKLKVEVELLEDEPKSRTCGAPVIRVNFYENQDSRRTVLGEIVKDPKLRRNTFISSGRDERCEARNEALFQGRDMFLCVGSRKLAALYGLVPDFSESLCSKSQDEGIELFYIVAMGGTILIVLFAGVFVCWFKRAQRQTRAAQRQRRTPGNVPYRPEATLTLNVRANYGDSNDQPLINNNSAHRQSRCEVTPSAPVYIEESSPPPSYSECILNSNKCSTTEQQETSPSPPPQQQ